MKNIWLFLLPFAMGVAISLWYSKEATINHQNSHLKASYPKNSTIPSLEVEKFSRKKTQQNSTKIEIGKLNPIKNETKPKEVNVKELEKQIKFYEHCQEIYKKLSFCSIVGSCSPQEVQTLKQEEERCDAKIIGK